MNRLISGAVQLLDEAAKRKSATKPLKYGYGGVNELNTRFDFEGYNHPHYEGWLEAVRKHPDFHHLETTFKDISDYSQGGQDSPTMQTSQHAVDEYGNSIGRYVVPHPTGIVNYPDTRNKRKK